MSTHESLSHRLPVEGSSNRTFGIVMATFFLVVSVIPLLHSGHLRGWPFGVAVFFMITAIAIPKSLGPLNRLWTQLGLLISRITSPIALGILYFGVVTPTGLAMKFLKKDILRLKFDRAAQSYWLDRTPAGPSPQSLKNQF